MVAFVAFMGLVALWAPRGDARQPSRWLEAHAPGLIVITNADEDRAREVATEVDRIRRMLRETFARWDRAPVLILAVRGEEDLRELLPEFAEQTGPRPAAAYWPGPYQHYIALRVGRDSAWRRHLVHELVHLVTRLNVPDAPAWLDEGLSELWSTVVVDDRGIEIGRRPPHHLQALRNQRRWIPLQELLAMNRVPAGQGRRRLAVFYAQSWALAHYVTLGREPAGVLAPRDYLERLRQGDDPVAAAKLTFGDLTVLERRLSAYVRTGRFPTRRLEPRPPAEGAAPIRVRALSVAESLAVRGRALTDGHRSAAAVALLRQAVRLDPNHAAALEALGTWFFQQNQPEEAARWFDRALATGSAGPVTYFSRAILLAPAPGAPGASERGRIAARHTERARLAESYLRQAFALDPTFAPAYARLADLVSEDPSRLSEAEHLARRAVEVEPENAAYWLRLGQLLLSLDRCDDAREAGQQALAKARTLEVRQAAEAFLRRIPLTPSGGLCETGPRRYEGYQGSERGSGQEAGAQVDNHAGPGRQRRMTCGS